MIKFNYGGFSHSEGMYGILEGIPFGLKIDEFKINELLKERQFGLGRSERQAAEVDKIKILSGIIDGISVGAPLVFCVNNKVKDRVKFSVPRPNHADLAGAIKNGMIDTGGDVDFSIISEAASGRNTVIVSAAGAICMQVLDKLGIEFAHRIINIAGIDYKDKDGIEKFIEGLRLLEDTAGGAGEVVVKGLRAGVGGYASLNDKLDGKLAGAVMSVPSIKAIEIGRGKEFEMLLGSECADEIYLDAKTIKRKSNNCGGIEGGVSNGQEILVRFSVKPLPSVFKDIKSIDFNTLQKANLKKLRTDVCAVESVSCVVKAVIAIEILKQIILQFNSSTMDKLIKDYEA
ncbi:MAG: chorismate synthase [Firmicutes bacterium]|nr:chorismate synthase [Bacillota bacterium]